VAVAPCRARAADGRSRGLRDSLRGHAAREHDPSDGTSSGVVDGRRVGTVRDVPMHDHALDATAGDAVVKCLQCQEDILRENVLVETWRSRGATLVRIVHVTCGYVLRDGTRTPSRLRDVLEVVPK